MQVSTTPSGTTAELMLKVNVVSTLHVWQSVLVVHDRGPPSVQLPLTQRLATQSVLVVQLCAPPPQFRAEEALWLVGEPEIAGLIVHAPEVATLKVVLSNLMKLEVPTTLLPFLVRVMSMLTFCPAKPLPEPKLRSGGVAHTVEACRSATAESITPVTADTTHPQAAPRLSPRPILVAALLRLGSEAAVIATHARTKRGVFYSPGKGSQSNVVKSSGNRRAEALAGHALRAVVVRPPQPVNDRSASRMRVHTRPEPIRAPPSRPGSHHFGASARSPCRPHRRHSVSAATCSCGDAHQPPRQS